MLIPVSYTHLDVYKRQVSTDKVNAEIDKLKVYNENLKFNSTKENIKHISKDIERCV